MVGCQLDTIFVELIHFFPSKHGNACKLLLEHVGAAFDKTIIPGNLDLFEILTNPSEVFGTIIGEEMKTTPQQQMLLRKNRSQFTAAEDNLLLRGVVRIEYTCFISSLIAS